MFGRGDTAYFFSLRVICQWSPICVWCFICQQKQNEVSKVSVNIIIIAVSRHQRRVRELGGCSSQRITMRQTQPISNKKSADCQIVLIWFIIIILNRQLKLSLKSVPSSRNQHQKKCWKTPTIYYSVHKKSSDVKESKGIRAPTEKRR